MRSLPVLTAILLCATGASAQLLWAPTATQGIGLANFNIAAQQLGPLPDSTPIHVLLALKPRNAAQMASTIAAINTPGNASYGHFLTPAQFTAAYAPTASQVQAVSQYLSQMGFTGISAPGNHLYVEARGTAGQAKAAFNTPINQFQITGPGTAPTRTVFANAATAQIPLALAGNVTAVIGLQNIDTMHTRLGRWPASVSPQAGLPAVQPTFSPQDFWKVYDVGSTPAATNTTIAIFAEGDLTGILPDPSNAAAPNDLRQFEAENGLAQVPVTIVKTGAGTSTDTSGAVEWDMDTQTSTGLAGSVARLIVYDGDSLDDTDLVPEFNRFVTDNLAQAGSASFGGCEILQQIGGSTALYSTIFAQAAAQGQTIFASSGDAGSACSVVGLTNGVPVGVEAQVEFPAASTYVVGVGGTTLVVDADFNVVLTTAWDAGGGGTSLFEPAGSWQTGFVPTAAIAKGVPDVAMDADFLASPAGFVSLGADTSNGGTSLASPLALGAWARLQSAHGNALGFAAPVLYSQATATLLGSTGKMTDIIVGTNGLFAATPGWDYTTGLGSFDIAALNAALH